jgi:hypothetical protein
MFRKTNKTTINKNKNDKFHGRFIITCGQVFFGGGGVLRGSILIKLYQI